jgi:hypothetical protein
MHEPKLATQSRTLNKLRITYNSNLENHVSATMNIQQHAKSTGPGTFISTPPVCAEFGGKCQEPYSIHCKRFAQILLNLESDAVGLIQVLEISGFLMAVIIGAHDLSRHETTS